jgi:hypothetical protein
MVSSVDFVKQTLPTLELKELEDLQALIKFLLDGKSSKGNATEDSIEILLYQAIAEVLEAENLTATPFFHFKKGPTYRQFRAGKEVVEKFLDKSFRPKKLTRTQRKKLYKMMICWVVVYLNEYNVPLSVRTIVNNLSKGPEFFLREFPEYLESKLFFKILERL